jgi:hypothetical protein
MHGGALDRQVGGSHYCGLPIQPFEFSASQNLDSFAHTIMKYITRWPNKGGIKDLHKAKHTAELRCQLLNRVKPILFRDFVKKNGLRQLEEAALLALDLWIQSGENEGPYFTMFMNSMDNLIRERERENCNDG